MKTLLLIITMLLLMGCKTKQTVKAAEKENEIISTTYLKDSVKNESKIQEKSKTQEVHKSEQKKENETDFEVKGKAETNKPLEIFNVENGDTLQAIKITGNAEVHFRTKTSKLNYEKKETASETITEKLKEFSQNVIEENNVKERVLEMKKKTQEVRTRTGTFWSFSIIAVLGAVLIIATGIYLYIKKK